MTIKVAIAGARGRLGNAALQGITEMHDMEVVAAFDYKHGGLFLHDTVINEEPGGIPFYTCFATMVAETEPDVLLDVTDPDAVFNNAKQAIEHGVRPVIGTSGISNESLATLEELAHARQVGTIIAPNFSIGAVLMMKFSAMAARYLGDVEILEMHHDRKLDAPSGTAVKTAEMIQAVRAAHVQGHPEEQEIIPGARGADIEGMKIHSIRLPGLLAHQEVLLGGEGELLSIRHDTMDRKSFIPGITLAIREVMNRNDFVYGLEKIID
ncbi:4-hydroxy-tetrahydrodipicolinate reductase [Sporosarcina sp. HYO08]|uniref:4-hydroxy-tetrahydrodipicolinate reductase n=1 Tax=Sporosarcina sp. HYO08 TaxID=1759557 RepID=UPI000799CA2E|nr:4-hydroxy-tetrahydrodipicolinate reductase [Sporosarcina sp. HYO08]KXH82000.1 4-hydroxy-tetrahydrodipicolinate reductase [Sporosarcina sp. HYO08]